MAGSHHADPLRAPALVRRQAQHNIYDELELYWNKERRYGILQASQIRDYLYEGKLNGSANFLIRTYHDRLHERNKEYETYYFKHLKRHLLRAGNIMNLASLGNALLLLYLYSQGEISMGSLVALSAVVLSSLSQSLTQATNIVTWSGYHIQFTDYYDKFFALSEDSVPGKAAPRRKPSISNFGTCGSDIPAARIILTY